ncbi:hypothetical protein NFHSH190041_30970 [Shewanella sp. NFH-SH190041]|uniref:DUF6482 family protein n=1 Tax=Shewanella sp. NFH-SH190041 TaxID=2950245 RepID=UPI0021C29F3C|nr:DUF6482 family protein [Shewanella sp. NFH-SH190041]BDM65645.1 hypothetical protein NFHSH190041_30970 [Shewanella sp. NFH-SH190041]
MLAAELKQQIIYQQGHPIIISYADSNHYLAGLEDKKGRFHSLSQPDGRITTFNSLSDAEHALAQLGADSVIVQMQTAYDEMVGSDTTDACRLTVPLKAREQVQAESHTGHFIPRI